MSPTVLKSKMSSTSTAATMKTSGKRDLKSNCTHVVMERLHGHPCSVCGVVPADGWVYACQEDALKSFSFVQDLITSLSVEALREEPAEYESLRKELEALGMDATVIANAEQGGYTAEQLQKLKSQKTRVKEVLAVEYFHKKLCHSVSTEVNSISQSPAAATSSPRETDFTKSTQTERSFPGRLDAMQHHLEVRLRASYRDPCGKCDFKCCRRCGSWKDRCFFSVPAVLADQPGPLNSTNSPKISSAHLLGKLGRQNGLSSQLFYSEDTSSESEAESAVSALKERSFKTDKGQVTDSSRQLAAHDTSSESNKANSTASSTQQETTTSGEMHNNSINSESESSTISDSTSEGEALMERRSAIANKFYKPRSLHPSPRPQPQAKAAQASTSHRAAAAAVTEEQKPHISTRPVPSTSSINALPPTPIDTTTSPEKHVHFTPLRRRVDEENYQARSARPRRRGAFARLWTASKPRGVKGRTPPPTTTAIYLASTTPSARQPRPVLLREKSRIPVRAAEA